LLDCVVAPARSIVMPRWTGHPAILEQGLCCNIYDGSHAGHGIGSPSLYAAFGSKEALYAEALQHYAETNEHFVWAGFHSADTTRGAVQSLLMDSAAALTGCVADMPRGCMVTLSSVGSEGHADLGETVKAARAVTLERLETRLEQAAKSDEISEATDIHALARFVQAVQAGMSILARDGASRFELEGMTSVAMAAWDARTRLGEKASVD
jgi:AcrR family transcriptional regulator